MKPKSQWKIAESWVQTQLFNINRLATWPGMIRRPTSTAFTCLAPFICDRHPSSFGQVTLHSVQWWSAIPSSLLRPRKQLWLPHISMSKISIWLIMTMSYRVPWILNPSTQVSFRAGSSSRVPSKWKEVLSEPDTLLVVVGACCERSQQSKPHLTLRGINLIIDGTWGNFLNSL